MNSGHDGAPRRILVLHARWETRGRVRSAVQSHLRVLEHSPAGHRILYYNALGGAPSWFASLRPDVIILHTTFLCMRWHPKFEAWKASLDWVRSTEALKIAIPQDEYDHSLVLARWLHDWGVDTVFSNFGEKERHALYGSKEADFRFRRCLTGYLDPGAAARVRCVPARERRLDLVYRATRLPFWFGSHGQLKHRIGEAAQSLAGGLGLRVDISTRTQDAIYGDRWLGFLGRGRAVLGCESGSSVSDPSGEIQREIRTFLIENPSATFEEVSARMPSGWDRHRFFALSPRHLEAAATRTSQILVRGDYDGVLEEGRHYVPVSPDLSDLREALERARDVSALEALSDAAFEEIARPGKYSISAFAAMLGEEIEKRPGEPWRGDWPGDRAKRAARLAEVRSELGAAAKGLLGRIPSMRRSRG